jgi:hypothetical protein
MMSKAIALGMQGATEDYEFSSGLHRVSCIAIFSLAEKVESFLFTIEKESEDSNG